jgi:hypothetical protein
MGEVFGGGYVLEQIVARLDLRVFVVYSTSCPTTFKVDIFAKLMSRFYLRIELRLEFQEKDIFSSREDLLTSSGLGVGSRIG